MIIICSCRRTLCDTSQIERRECLQLTAMERIRGWLLRRNEDPPADEDTVSSLPLLHRQGSGLRPHSGDGNESEASVGSTGFSFGGLLHRLTPSTHLLKLTDPDKGERSTLLNRGALWTPDRGPGFYQTQRDRWSAPHLVTTGRQAQNPCGHGQFVLINDVDFAHCRLESNSVARLTYGSRRQRTSQDPTSPQNLTS